MRLIDADNMDFTELTDRLCTIGMTGDLTDNGAEELLKEFINAQPTAYDVEKVVAELEEYRAIGTAEELKFIKQWKSDVVEGFCKYDASSIEELVENARSKAIDEFMLLVVAEYDNDGCPNVTDYLDYRLTIRELYEIAEQMKEVQNDRINN